MVKVCWCLLLLTVKSGQELARQFVLDNVFNMNISQENVFDVIGKPFVDCLLRNSNRLPKYSYVQMRIVLL
jgi:hypothetical protein